MNAIEKKLGYVFRDKRLLEQALTHSSVTSDIHRNYERLEFLGDRILGVTIAEMLYHTFGDEQEGSLAQRFVTLVCKETVADVMRSLEMEKNILAANQDVKDKDNVLCDIGEALIAAIYLDSGDMSLAQQFIKRFWLPYIDKKSQPQKDYKTFLQEKAASLHLNAPVYEVIDKRGPEHTPVFTVCVHVGSFQTQGSGSSKKHAEQEAASLMLQQLDK